MEADKAAHEVAMAAHIGEQAMAAALAEGATNEEAIAAEMATSASSLGAGDAKHMQH